MVGTEGVERFVPELEDAAADDVTRHEASGIGQADSKQEGTVEANATDLEEAIVGDVKYQRRQMIEENVLESERGIMIVDDVCHQEKDVVAGNVLARAYAAEENVR